MVKNLVQPTTVINWSDSLAEHYKRQSDQLAEHHQNLRERDQQEKEAEKGIEPWVKGIEAAGQLAQFSMTISSALEQRKQKKLKKEWKSKTSAEKAAIKQDYKLRSENLKLNDTEQIAKYKVILEKEYGKNSKFVTEAIEAAQALKGSDHLKFMELSSREAVAMMTKEAIEAGIFSVPGAEDEYLTKPPELQEADRRQWVNKELKRLGYSDGIIEELDLEIDRKLTTTNTKKNQAAVNAATGRLNRFKERLATASRTAGFDFSQFAHDEIRSNIVLYTDKSKEGGLTAKQQATQAFLNNLRQLGKDRRFSREDFESLINGEVWDYVDDGSGNITKKSTGIGKTFKDVYLGGDALEGWEQHVLDGIEEGENMTYAQLQVMGETEFSNIYNRAQRGELKFGSSEYNTAITRLMNLPIKNREKKLEDLERVARFDQSKETGTKLLATYKNRILTGNLTKDKDTINKIGHVGVRNFLLQKEESQTTAANAVNLTSHINGFNGTISAGKKGPFGISGVTDATKAVQLDVENYLRRSYFAKIEAAEEQGQVPNYAVLLEEAKTETRTYMTDNGFGVTDINDPNYGKFSINGTKGDYDNYVNNYSVTKTNATNNYDAKLTVENAVQWDKNFANNPNKTNFKIPGAIFSNEMLAGFLKTGRPSAEMLYIASKYKTNISRLIGYSIDALINNPRGEADKAFAGNFNIKQVDTKHLPDETLLTSMSERIKVLNTRPLEATKAQDLNTIRLKAQRHGFDSLSQNEIQRFLLYMDYGQSAIPEDISKGVTETREGEEARKEAIKAGRELDKQGPTDYI